MLFSLSDKYWLRIFDFLLSLSDDLLFFSDVYLSLSDDLLSLSGDHLSLFDDLLSLSGDHLSLFDDLLSLSDDLFLSDDLLSLSNDLSLSDDLLSLSDDYLSLSVARVLDLLLLLLDDHVLFLISNRPLLIFSSLRTLSSLSLSDDR